MVQHATAVALAQAGPLLRIRSLEGGNEIVQHAEQLGHGGKCSRISIHVYGAIIPRRNSLARLVMAGRNIRVRPVKDDQAAPLLRQIFPMGIGFGHVPSEPDLVPVLPDHHGHMRREWLRAAAGHDNCKRICPHEGQRRRGVFNTEMFRNVHELCRPPRGWLT